VALLRRVRFPSASAEQRKRTGRGSSSPAPGGAERGPCNPPAARPSRTVGATSAVSSRRSSGSPLTGWSTVEGGIDGGAVNNAAFTLPAGFRPAGTPQHRRARRRRCLRLPDHRRHRCGDPPRHRRRRDLLQLRVLRGSLTAPGRPSRSRAGGSSGSSLQRPVRARNREGGAVSEAEAAWLLRVPQSTLNYWLEVLTLVMGHGGRSLRCLSPRHHRPFVGDRKLLLERGKTYKPVIRVEPRVAGLR
jgi:hypothetical protein